MKPRRIEASGTQTPLLVPSFSSADPWGKGRYKAFAGQLGERLLLSAYDIHHHDFDIGLVKGTELAIIDSGGYEARVAERYAKWLNVTAPAWSASQYHDCIEALPDGPNYLLVTYDYGQQFTYAEQFQQALKFAARHQGRPVDWLVKPEPDQQTIDPIKLAAIIAEDHPFNVIGVTHDELGRSIQERVQNLRTIRNALDQAKPGTPIHIFGCLTFSAILPLLEAGGDIFDGLAWTRFVMQKGRALNAHDFRLSHNYHSMPYQDYFPFIDSENIDNLDVMQNQLRLYAKNHDTEWLGAWCPEFPAYITKIRRETARHG